LLQPGWRASGESNDKGQPFMSAKQLWQVFARVATRYGELRAHVSSANLTREGVSALIHNHRKKLEAEVEQGRGHRPHEPPQARGMSALLTMWLGDDQAERWNVLSSDYQLGIATKEPWRLDLGVCTNEALIATGREAFKGLRDLPAHTANCWIC
jgi:hypothetical protein